MGRYMSAREHQQTACALSALAFFSYEARMEQRPATNSNHPLVLHSPPIGVALNVTGDANVRTKKCASFLIAEWS